MLPCKRQCFADSTGRRLQLLHHRILGLSSGPAVVDNELVRNAAGHHDAEIILNHRLRQINAGGHACGSPDPAIVDEYAIAIYCYSGELALKCGGVSPVRGRATPIQQPCTRQYERTRAHAGNPTRLDSAPLDGRHNIHRSGRELRARTTGEDQRVKRLPGRRAAGHWQPCAAFNATAVRRHDMRSIQRGLRLHVRGVE